MPFQTHDQFKANLKNQLSMTPDTLAQLREHGVSDEKELRLEFFFYSDNSDSGVSLNTALSAIGYDSECRESADDSTLFVITGWTTPIRMDTETVLVWTQEMCEMGFNNDAEFDGWGTRPDQ